MKLITESSFDVQINEGKDKSLYVTGIFSSAELKNQNGRIYKRSTLDEQVKQYQKRIENKNSWGELCHPNTPEINPERISHIVEAVEWKGNNLYGRAKILDTPIGNIAKTLIKEGRIGISSRGLGTVNEQNSYVNEDFKLITWDLVMEPSNSPSWMNGIYEGKEFYISEIETKKSSDINIEEAKDTYTKWIMDTFLPTLHEASGDYDLDVKGIQKWMSLFQNQYNKGDISAAKDTLAKIKKRVLEIEKNL